MLSRSILLSQIPKESIFYTSPEKARQIDEIIEENRRVVKPYYEAEDVETKFLQVENAQLKVYHHNPEFKEFKYPIIFVPGFGTPPIVWGDFSVAIHGKTEYVVVESREKRSAIISERKKSIFTVDQMAKDLRDIIDLLGFNKKDYILVGGCWGGSIVLEGIIRGYLNPYTVVLHDPFPKMGYKKKLAKALFTLMPAFMLEMFKYVIGFFFLFNEKNLAQKKRNQDILKEAVGWKWRRSILQNLDFDLHPEFYKISREVYIFHGPKDKIHTREWYYNMACQIPNGRFFFMNCADEKRELLLSSIVKEFSANTGDGPVPLKLQKFEMPLSREPQSN